MLLFLMLMICVYIVLGFMYSWVMNIVSKEDVPVTKGAIILFLVAIITILIGAVIKDQNGWVQLLVITGGQFGALIGLTIVIAGLQPKHAAISAVCYAVLLFVLSVVLGMCMG